MNMTKRASIRKMIFPILTEEDARLPFRVTGVGALENQHPAVRPTGLRDYQILYTTAGRGYAKIDGREYDVGAGAGFFFAPGVRHEYHAVEEPWTTWWVTFNGYALRDFPAVANMGKAFAFDVFEMDLLHHLHGNVHAAVSIGGPSAAADASGELYRLLLDFGRCVGSDARRARHDQLRVVLDFVDANFAGDISLADMAASLGVSAQHLCRLFRQAFGMRPFEYLTKRRLQKAKELLTGAENLTLKEIAPMVGLGDPSYLCAVFRRVEGMTPDEFRRAFRNG